MNAFCMYTWYHKLFGITPEYSPFDLVNAVAQAWIDPVNHWPTYHCVHLALIDKNSSKLHLFENWDQFLIVIGYCLFFSIFLNKDSIGNHHFHQDWNDNLLTITSSYIPFPKDPSKDPEHILFVP